jgi:hypothetical protein
LKKNINESEKNILNGLFHSFYLSENLKYKKYFSFLDKKNNERKSDIFIKEILHYDNSTLSNNNNNLLGKKSKLNNGEKKYLSGNLNKNKYNAFDNSKLFWDNLDFSIIKIALQFLNLEISSEGLNKLKNYKLIKILQSLNNYNNIGNI